MDKIAQIINAATADLLRDVYENLPQFHGDTDLMQHWRCRLMIHGDQDLHVRAGSNGVRAKLLVPEFPTTLLYQQSGKGITNGRLDYAIVFADDVDPDGSVPCRGRARAAIEFGLNKPASKMGDIEAPKSAVRV
jgi:hypothetical protein